MNCSGEHTGSRSKLTQSRKLRMIQSIYATIFYSLLSSDNFFVVYNNDHDIHRKRPQSSDLG